MAKNRKSKDKIISKTVDISVPKVLPEIVIYTDGGANPNPGRGGFGILFYIKDRDVIELSKGFKLTTNNRMEIMAVVVAVEQIESMGIDGDIVIYSDSQNTINAINTWIYGWYKKRWKKSDGSKVSNLDLWKRYMDVLISRQRKGYFISGVWIKGHDGHLQNERCDLMARIAMHSDDLLEDEGYTSDHVEMSLRDQFRASQLHSRDEHYRPKHHGKKYRRNIWIR